MTGPGSVAAENEVEVGDVVAGEYHAALAGQVISTGRHELQSQGFKEAVPSHDDRRIRDVEHDSDVSGASASALADRQSRSTTLTRAKSGWG